MMTKIGMKETLTAVIKVAVEEHLRTARGAAVFGADAKVVQPSRTQLQIHSKTALHGLAFFEIRIKESY